MDRMTRNYIIKGSTLAQRFGLENKKVIRYWRALENKHYSICNLILMSEGL